MWYTQGADDARQYEEYGRVGIGADLLLERDLTFRWQLRSGDFWTDDEVELYYADLSWRRGPWLLSARQETYGWGNGAQLLQLNVQQPWYAENLLAGCRSRDLLLEWRHGGWRLAARCGATDTESAASAVQAQRELDIGTFTAYGLVTGKDTEYGYKALSAGAEVNLQYGPGALYGGGDWTRWTPEKQFGEFERWTWLAEPGLRPTENVQLSGLFYQQGSAPGHWHRRLIMTSVAWTPGRWLVQPYAALNDWNDATRRGCHLLLGYNVTQDWRVELMGGWSGGADVNDAWDMALQWKFRYEASDAGGAAAAAAANRL